MARDNTPETPVANGPYKARSRSGCVTCRQRHLKCDEIKPTCGRCRKSRRQCVPTDLDHRATRGSVVRFVDESSRFYRRSGTREPDDEPPAGWSVTEVGINSPTATIFEQQVGLAQPLTERLLSPPRDETDSELGSFETITDRSVVDDDRSTNERQNTHDSQGNHRTTLGSPQSPFETTAWWNQISSKRAVLDDYEVYRLMRHYVEVVGPWLDLTDSKRHYSTVVPQLALKCPVLMNAILAFSARHLHRLEGYEAMIAEYYHNEAIKVMIPMLQDQAVANDGTLLATTIILRMYETLEPSGQDVQQHLGGSCSLIGANGLTAHSDDLHKASFWLYLRQDIHMAELHQKRTIIDLENCAFVEHLLAADHANPDVWANHIYWILGLVINYCFGSHLAPSYHRWLTLREMVSKWREDTPESYFPCFFADPVGDVPGEGNVFPVIWLLSDIYVTANQAWHTCNILLSLYSPLPTTGGFDEFRHRRSEQTQIINHARRLCGISITNESDSARICASPQLALAGRCLETAEERNRLLRIFADLNTSTTWPIAPFIASLEKYWGSAG